MRSNYAFLQTLVCEVHEEHARLNGWVRAVEEMVFPWMTVRYFGESLDPREDHINLALSACFEISGDLAKTINPSSDSAWTYLLCKMSNGGQSQAPLDAIRWLIKLLSAQWKLQLIFFQSRNEPNVNWFLSSSTNNGHASRVERLALWIETLFQGIPA